MSFFSLGVSYNITLINNTAQNIEANNQIIKPAATYSYTYSGGTSLMAYGGNNYINFKLLMREALFSDTQLYNISIYNPEDIHVPGETRDSLASTGNTFRDTIKVISDGKEYKTKEAADERIIDGNSFFELTSRSSYETKQNNNAGPWSVTYALKSPSKSNQSIGKTTRMYIKISYTDSSANGDTTIEFNNLAWGS